MFDEKKKYCKNCEHRINAWECKLAPSNGVDKGKPEFVSCEVMRDIGSRCGEEAKLFKRKGK